MLKAKYFTQGKTLLHTAVVTLLVILPLGVARAQDGPKKAKTIVEQHADGSQKFDVLIHRSVDNKKKRKSGHAKPVALAITFEDGSTQEVDISKYRFITIDVNDHRVKMHPAGQPPKLVGYQASASLAHAVSDKAPVRVPLPKKFAPDKSPNKLKSRNVAAKKIAKPRDKDVGDAGRLDQLEAMLHDLQKQVKLLHAEIESHH